MRISISPIFVVPGTTESSQQLSLNVIVNWSTSSAATAVVLGLDSVILTVKVAISDVGKSMPN